MECSLPCKQNKNHFKCLAEHRMSTMRCKTEDISHVELVFNRFTSNYTGYESCVCPMFQARSLLVGGWLVNGRNCRDVKRYHSTLLGNEKGIERKTYILEHPHSNLVNWERFRTRFFPRTAPLLVVKGFFQPIRRETAWSRKNSAVLWGVWANQNSHSGKLICGVP